MGHVVAAEYYHLFKGQYGAVEVVETGQRSVKDPLSVKAAGRGITSALLFPSSAHAAVSPKKNADGGYANPVQFGLQLGGKFLGVFLWLRRYKVSSSVIKGRWRPRTFCTRKKTLSQR